MKKAEVKKTKTETLNNTNFDVYVDFIFDDGLFFILIKNYSDNPVFNVSVKFNKKITGVSGLKEITSINLFRNIEFLPPKKEIKTFLDSSESFFRRKQPTKIVTEIIFNDVQNHQHKIIIKHDLEIYRDIGYAFKTKN